MFEAEADDLKLWFTLPSARELPEALSSVKPDFLFKFSTASQQRGQQKGVEKKESERERERTNCKGCLLLTVISSRSSVVCSLLNQLGWVRVRPSR